MKDHTTLVWLISTLLPGVMWASSTWAVRRRNIKDGISFHELVKASSQPVKAVHDMRDTIISHATAYNDRDALFSESPAFEKQSIATETRNAIKL